MGYRIQKIYVGTHQVRPAVVPPFTPGANTVAYYPLTDDFNDYSGNGYNLTSNSCQIITLGSVKCCDLNSSSCSANFVITTLPYTIAFWNKSKTSSLSKIFSVIFKEGGSWGGSGIKMEDNNSTIHIRYGNTTDTHSSISYTANTDWHLYVTTFDSDGCKLYIDGQLYNTPKNSLQNPTNNSTPLYIGAKENGNLVNNSYQGETIIENKSRTAQEVADYYNLAKSNYGIS